MNLIASMYGDRATGAIGYFHDSAEMSVRNFTYGRLV